MDENGHWILFNEVHLYKHLRQKHGLYKGGKNLDNNYRVEADFSSIVLPITPKSLREVLVRALTYQIAQVINKWATLGVATTYTILRLETNSEMPVHRILFKVTRGSFSCFFFK